MNKQTIWFHGSNLKLETLRKGSTITQIEKLAQVFSTRPSIVSVADDGTIKHNGTSNGRVYKVAADVTINDIYEHPQSSMNKGWEWITKKEFTLEFLYETPYIPEDILSENEINEISERHIPS